MALTINVTSVNVTCNGANNGSIVVTSVTGGTAPYTYRWEKDGVFYSNDKDIYFLLAGSYTVFATDSLGVVAQRTIVITQFNPILAHETIRTPLCNALTGSIGLTPTGGSGGGYTYLWNNGSTSNPLLVVAGTYSVVITDSSGCKATFTFVIPDKALPSLTIQQSLEDCYEKSIVLTALFRCEDGTVVWSTGETAASIIAASGTTYTLTLSCPNGAAPPCVVTRTFYIPTQAEAWRCCMFKQFANKNDKLINGDSDCGCGNDTNLLLLYLNIQAYERFGMECLSDEQKQIITDNIEKVCNCGCGDVATI